MCLFASSSYRGMMENEKRYSELLIWYVLKTNYWNHTLIVSGHQYTNAVHKTWLVQAWHNNTNKS